MLALAADHVVHGQRGLRRGLPRRPRRGASAGRIVTFGVKPARPATEYGYIRPGRVMSGQVRAVERFVEKPDAVNGGATTSAEGYLWNTGNFMFPRHFLLDEYRSFDAASVAGDPEAVSKAGSDLGFVTLEPDAFGAAKAISIDYAVMEKTARAAVMPVSYGWSDVGSWHAVWELSEKDAQGNAVAWQCGVRGFAQLLRRHRQAALVALGRRRSRRRHHRRMRCWSRARRMPTA